ncbi:MAG: class I SAM-dependent methyltransferase [Coxiellaceae bacterium]|nr:class I SAM-dependent methyltransferase [Coxiellaceae bacterium]
MANHIVICCKNPDAISTAEQLAAELSLPVVTEEQGDACLLVTESGLALSLPHSRLSPINVDFLGGQLGHRRAYGGGKGQLIAKAVGLQKTKALTVVDVTAGLGKDAFVLATLGCRVTMIERSPIMCALLQDGLTRFYQDPRSDQIQLSLLCQNSIVYLQQLDKKPDVIYIDPMYPERTKSSLVKKEMRMIKTIVGDDVDADALLFAALGKAQKRVVVKRPKGAPSLAGKKPSHVYAGKSIRYDVYIGD